MHPFTISSVPSAQLGPKLAHAGSDFIAVWEDRRSGAGGDIFGVIVPGRPPSSGPSATVVYPVHNSSTSNSYQAIKVLITDPDGVDESSIVFNVDGSTYTITSPTLSMVSDTLIFSSSVPFSDNDTINCSLTSASDRLGNPMSGSVSWRFLTDFSPPSFIGESPRTSIPSLSDLMATVNISDAVTGVNPSSIRAMLITSDNWRHSDTLYINPSSRGFYWNGTTFAILMDSLTINTDRSAVINITVYAEDNPSYGSPMRVFLTGVLQIFRAYSEHIPTDITLSLAYPNPFNGSVNLYNPKAESFVIYDIEGKVVSVLTAYNGIASFTPDDETASGVFLYKAGHEEKIVGKLMYIK
jgi:hypothetical protein